jgi:hypothetical protein
MSAPSTTAPALATIHHGYGGELDFWVSLIKGEVPAGVREVYAKAARELARRGNDRCLRDLESLEEPGADADLDAVLEAGPCLVDALPGILSGDHPRKSSSPIIEQVRAGVLDLLETVGVELPPGREALVGTDLVKELTGRAAMDRFERHVRWLTDVRRRYAAVRPLARLRVIDRLNAKVFAAREDGGYRYHLSFRLYLRSRLYQLCQAGGWSCRAPNGLMAAFAEVSRDRIGEVFARSLTYWEATTEAYGDVALQYLVHDVVAAG